MAQDYIFKPINEQSKAKPKFTQITFDTEMKTTLRVFDMNRLKCVTCMSMICVSPLVVMHPKLAQEIFYVIDEKLRADNIPWSNAVSLCVDTTNSLLGGNNSFASQCKQRNPAWCI